jgi:hypothetical protein
MKIRQPIRAAIVLLNRRRLVEFPNCKSFALYKVVFSLQAKIFEQDFGAKPRRQNGLRNKTNPSNARWLLAFYILEAPETML